MVLKGYIYLTLTSISLLRGLYLDDKEIIICSLLVLPLCVIFILGSDQDRNE
jgi:hypothetical protein